MKILFLCWMFFGMLITGCNQKKSVESTNSEDEKPSPKTLIYEGIVPCADCSGIKTTLRLFLKIDTEEEHRFELIRVYLDKDKDYTGVKTGNFNLEKGIDDDKEASVYVLDWDKNKDEREYFAVYSNDQNTMYQLDIEGKRIESPLNYSLKKKE